MQREIILEQYSYIDGRTIYFEKYREDKLIKTVKIDTLVKEHNDFKYILMIDTYGKTIFEAYKYLNVQIGNAKWNKREKAILPLKLLFSFVELFNIMDYKNLSREEFSKFTAFLNGGIQKGNIVELRCKTARQPSTLNQYMSIYRDFYDFLGVSDSVFNETKTVSTVFNTSNTSSGYRASIEQYKFNQNQLSTKKVPKYININEYTKILSLLDQEDNNYGLREKIIIRLMFEHGLRLSEVLGLTLEDIEPLNNGYGKIILRNRTSDKEYHHCKNLIIPKSSIEYNSKGYNTEKIGFHTIIVTNEIINLINEYIDDTRNVFSMTAITIKNIEAARADKVSIRNSSVRENYYIFLNKNYKPLSKSGWNKTLRKIYETVGIEVDTEVKKNNLSHRLRHGFAMMCIQNGVDRYTLKELLRHRKVATVDIYFNPTTEDNIQLAIEVSKLIQTKIGINIQQQIKNVNGVI